MVLRSGEKQYKKWAWACCSGSLLRSQTSFEVRRGEAEPGWGLCCFEEVRCASVQQAFDEVILEETCLISAKFISLCKGIYCQWSRDEAGNDWVISVDALSFLSFCVLFHELGALLGHAAAEPGQAPCWGDKLPGKLRSSRLSSSCDFWVKILLLSAVKQ